MISPFSFETRGRVLAKSEESTNSNVQYVYTYSWQLIRQIIAEFTRTNTDDCDKKYHFEYLPECFEHPVLDIKTVVLERDYVDKDFLDDFAAYYVRCYKRYRKHCLRIHFFSFSFSQEDFDAMLTGKATKLTIKTLEETNKGFVVIKPLPKQFIGRTCIVPPIPDNERELSPSSMQRKIVIRRYYKSNLYGVALPIRTMAFQEQDRVAAACATSAIWSALQGTGEIFRVPVPSPIRITAEACKYIPAPDRSFPNTGLTTSQMINALKNSGIDPLLINFNVGQDGDDFTHVHLPSESPPSNCRNTLGSQKSLLTESIAGHVYSGVPIILGCKMGNMGEHAVTVTGCEYGAELLKQSGRNIAFSHSRMNKLFVHDDQVGPYAELGVNDDGTLSSHWWPEEYTPIVPVYLIIPLYHKIRIPISHIYAIVMEFNVLFTRAFSDPGIREWDIRLTSVDCINNWIRTAESIDHLDRLAFIKSPKPRFIWWATAWVGSDAILELFFDATDIQNGSIFLGLLSHRSNLRKKLQTIARNGMSGPMKSSRSIHVWLAGEIPGSFSPNHD